ncbi:MAG: hypothetical protein BWK76_09875 [Desulfobulbaceae bacterium A2]|nr:MAG: hypothetical protein BWK76_09875 [Desulfobulbaceae bacterium A2]
MNSVRVFRQMLVWPLYLVGVGQGQTDIAGDEVAQRLVAAGWVEEPDRMLRGGNDQAAAYAEFVYFHPFVQRFLYDSSSPLRLFSCSGVAALQVDTFLKGEKITACLAIERLHLHLFAEMATVLCVIELSAEDLPLPQAQNLLDQVRRAYPPYWNDQGHAGHCPGRVVLIDAEGNKVEYSTYTETREQPLDFLRRHGQPQAAEHWRQLLQPFTWERVSQEDGRRIAVRHIMDDRMPHMACLAFEAPCALTRGDMIRLGFADDQGSRTTLPYAEKFLHDFEQRHCYDRFWGEDHEPRWLSTRYVITEYAFTIIGCDDRESKWPMFTNEKTGILCHFRRHYFQLFLIALLYRASLLILADRLAAKIEDLRRKTSRDRERFADDARAILEQLQIFTHRYWFAEVSNLVQGKELFQRILREQGTTKLYERVSRASQELNELLETEFQRRDAELTARLTVVAAVGLVLSLVTGYFGMETILPGSGKGQEASPVLHGCLASHHSAESWWSSVLWPGDLRSLGVVLALFFAIFFLSILFSRWLARGIDWLASIVKRLERRRWRREEG